jgi:hypothetical protein
MPVRAAVEKSHIFNRTSVTLLLSNSGYQRAIVRFVPCLYDS